MSSERVKINRIVRRKLEREKKKEKEREIYDKVDILKDPYLYIKAFGKTRSGVAWKPSVQNWELSLYNNITYSIHKVLAMENTKLEFHYFYLNERGKLRYIQSINVTERVIQHVLCDECIYPAINKIIISDNAASIKHRGTDFTIKRLSRHLQEFYRRNNQSNDGCILLIDFKDFFGSLSHKVLHNIIDEIFITPEIRFELKRIIDSFDGDVGIGLGSQVSQLLAVIYVNKVDHYIKEVLRIRGYGRYNDDSYFILLDEDECRSVLKILMPKYEAIGLTVNMEKTKIIHLNDPKGFKFLKKTFILTDSGRVLIWQNPKNLLRFRHKMRKFKELYDNGEIDLDYVSQNVKDWKAINQQYMRKKQIISSINYVNSLFGTIVVDPYE